VTTSQSPVIMYTDGACSGNPGPGGWGVLIIEDGRERELSGGENPTTNQRMELTAPIQGLRVLEGRRRVEIHSDSAYVINCFRDKWYERWRKNGWLNAQKKPVENRDLWEALIAQVERHDVTWHKVAGHSGHPENDRADALARSGIPR
jgi:ribonuclease HI